MIAIDILYLVDRMEELLNNSKRLPMSSKIMVDQDEILDIVDQMRIAIPEEIKQARKVHQDQERTAAQAKEEAARVIMLAKEDAARLVNEHAVIKTASERSAQIEQAAKEEAEATRKDADQYASQVLTGLKTRLEVISKQIEALQSQVENGLNFLRGEKNPGSGPESNREKDQPTAVLTK